MMTDLSPDELARIDQRAAVMTCIAVSQRADAAELWAGLLVDARAASPDALEIMRAIEAMPLPISPIARPGRA